MIRVMRRLLRYSKREALLGLALLVSAAAVILLPRLQWDDITSIKICLSIMSGTLGIDTIVRAFENLRPENTQVISAFYTNRKASRASWLEKIGQIRKTLIISGATAQVMLEHTADLKEIVKKKDGRVIILIPKIHDESIVSFYKDLIGANALQSGWKYMRDQYSELLKELSGEIDDPKERVLLIEHDKPAAFGLTMYDPENQEHGVVRVELYGLWADDRPSFDITRRINPILYGVLGARVSQQLGCGCNPTERSFTNEEISYLKDRCTKITTRRQGG